MGISKVHPLTCSSGQQGGGHTRRVTALPFSPSHLPATAFPTSGGCLGSGSVVSSRPGPKFCCLPHHPPRNPTMATGREEGFRFPSLPPQVPSGEARVNRYVALQAPAFARYGVFRLGGMLGSGSVIFSRTGPQISRHPHWEKG